MPVALRKPGAACEPFRTRRFGTVRHRTRLAFTLPVCGICLAVLCTGCATGRYDVGLSPAEPRAVYPSNAAPCGTLVVYSAGDPGIHFDALAYRAHYSDYELQTVDGKSLKRVHNDNDSGVGGPRNLRLPPGRYRVVAHANGYGKVTVPVVIRPDKVTTLRLDVSQAESPDAQASQGSP